jgi:cyclohexa-1,5-dienecarbonyl-CoA hydratase
MVLLRGEGGTFSQGASVAEHRKEQAPSMLAAFRDLVRDVATYPVPVAALVEGRCMGGAFELVLACHLVFARPGAVMGCPEIKLGVVPPVLAVLGHLRLGGALAERLLITGADLDVAAAERAGLLAATLPADGDPEGWVLAWYRKTFGAVSAFSLREAVHAARTGSGFLAALDEPLQVAERRYMDRLLSSHDGNEGIEAFLEKRAPRWVDA